VDAADAVVIGGGISGCGIARELCRMDCGVLLLEKASDIADGTTKANNGMIHSGYDSKFGSLKARLNVEGNAGYELWAKDLGFPFNRTGSFVCGYDKEDEEIIGKYLENGRKNAVPGVEILDGNRAREIEPALSKDIEFVLWTPSAGYVKISLYGGRGSSSPGHGRHILHTALGRQTRDWRQTLRRGKRHSRRDNSVQQRDNGRHQEAERLFPERGQHDGPRRGRALRRRIREYAQQAWIHFRALSAVISERKPGSSPEFFPLYDADRRLNGVNI
jgi:hypothetical protein